MSTDEDRPAADQNLNSSTMRSTDVDSKDGPDNEEIDPVLDQFIRLLAQAAVRRDRRAAMKALEVQVKLQGDQRK